MVDVEMFDDSAFRGSQMSQLFWLEVSKRGLREDGI